MTSATLPPRPDAETGEPRPPRAPVEASHDEGFPETDPARRPTKLPPGEGPMLEWYRPNRRYAQFAGAFGVGWIIFVFTFNWLASGEGLSYLTNAPRPGWFLLVAMMPLLLGGVLYWSFRREFIAAGAEWTAHETGWVRTYELTEVRSRAGPGKIHICFTDTAGRKMDPTLSLLQHNRDLWDLVYNGILHSIRDRDVATDHIARQTLQLHGPLMARDVADGRYRDGDSAATGKSWRRGRLYRRGRRQS